MLFKQGPIDGVVVKKLTKHLDSRGWLTELFRADEIDQQYLPVMSYISSTEPGITRGPHEHTDQADIFCFVGPSIFRIYLWDNRDAARTFRNKMVLEAGEHEPRSIIIPAGVVHAYRNVGTKPGWVINLPNRLYGGERRNEPADEIRHENDDHSIFQLD